MSLYALIQSDNGIINYPIANILDDGLLTIGRKGKMFIIHADDDVEEPPDTLKQNIKEGLVEIMLNDNNMSDDTYAASLLALVNKAMLSDKMMYNIYHENNRRNKLIADVMNDLDAVRDFAIPIEVRSDLGIILKKIDKTPKNMYILSYALNTLAAIHKRGIIMGSISPYGRIDVLDCKFYAGYDDISHLDHIIGKVKHNYQNDALRRFKIATIYDVGIYVRHYAREWNIKEHIDKYLKGNIKEWFIDIIVEEFKSYKI